jgi:hypothetical protein
MSAHVLTPLAVSNKSERKVNSLPLLGLNRSVIFRTLAYLTDHSAKSHPLTAQCVNCMHKRQSSWWETGSIQKVIILSLLWNKLEKWSGNSKELDVKWRNVLRNYCASALIRVLHINMHSNSSWWNLPGILFPCPQSVRDEKRYKPSCCFVTEWCR